jgi:vacuolar-type H+-ATPase subunit E/Vma4
MKAQEKAKELFDNYFDMKWQSYSHRKTSIKSMTKHAAKQCALIAVDEIINAIDFDWMQVQNLDREHAYWQQVKTEINNL